MKIRRTAALAASVSSIALLSAGLLAPAEAADTGSTAVTFTLTGGTLDITAPDTADLGSGSTAALSQVSAALGAVTVTDDRGELAATWTVTVHTDGFTGVRGKTIGAGQTAYSSGTVTKSSLLGVTPTIGATMAVDPVLEGVGTGSNTASWNPTVTVTVPAAAVADTYSGTITHSVL